MVFNKKIKNSQIYNRQNCQLQAPHPCKHHTHAHTGIGAQSFYRLSSMVKEYTIQLYIYVNMHA
jgi:hypothetical protein